MALGDVGQYPHTLHIRGVLLHIAAAQVFSLEQLALMQHVQAGQKGRRQALQPVQSFLNLCNPFRGACPVQQLELSQPTGFQGRVQMAGGSVGTDRLGVSKGVAIQVAQFLKPPSVTGEAFDQLQ